MSKGGRSIFITLNRFSPETGQVVTDIEVDNIIEILQVSLAVIAMVASVGAWVRNVVDATNAVKVVLPGAMGSELREVEMNSNSDHRNLSSIRRSAVVSILQRDNVKFAGMQSGQHHRQVVCF